MNTMINPDKIQADVVNIVTDAIFVGHNNLPKLEGKDVNQETLDYLFMFGLLLSSDKEDGVSQNTGWVLSSLN
jgi:hypothetical protein